MTLNVLIEPVWLGGWGCARPPNATPSVLLPFLLVVVLSRSATLVSRPLRPGALPHPPRNPLAP